MATILHIDTALHEASVMIATNGTVNAFTENKILNEHASFLHTAIQKVLEDANTSINNLDAIAVANGPGSYTGLRVGLAAAKGICYALNKPLICIQNLLIMATAAAIKVQDSQLLYVPMIDARRMEVFTAMYNFEGKSVLEPHALVLNEKSFSDQLQANKILFFGNAIDKWEKICAHPNALFSTPYDQYDAFATLSHDALMTNNFSDIAYTEPFYLKEFYIGNS
jgi:tRNA threonylcarbamoyladenosine biosynthesis protein TsaB